MTQLRITGRTPLEGSLVVSGRKNAALKLLAASLLTDRPVTIRRLPDIGDVRTMMEILNQLGCQITHPEPGTVTVDASGVSDPVIPSDLGKALRASIVLVGPLLARFGTVRFPHPGGCVIGKRSIEPHLEAFQSLGARIEQQDDEYTMTAPRLTGSEIYLKEKSVTGTENLMMAACLANGSTVLYNAAEEHHIGNLADLLRNMGYRISGDGTSTVRIEGNDSLSSQSAEIETLPDEVEVGTFAVASVITGGHITLERVGSQEGLFPILSTLDDFQVRYTYHPENQSLEILPSPGLTGNNVQVAPWPGFPPDLQSPFTVLATQAKGSSLIHDWMYEGRLYFVDLLQKMGADIVTCDPHRVLVSGPTELRHSSLISPDLRAGAALVLAALTAEGTSTIEHAELIDRGYAAIDERLRSLGAQITRE
ncbi:UDP-N-acetylglucosamine 1-carboxyvinyltransferase [Patescibacteria group bacterium]|nr:UDP-N-acetylglucosamine 1-carboxyvinyltransferase [Patescibacteria group bacterium]